MLGIERVQSEFQGADLPNNILYFQRGSEKFDLVIEADGGESAVRSFLEIEYPDEFGLKIDHSPRRMKRITMNAVDVENIFGFDKEWGNSVHVWKSGSEKLLCVPCTGGGLTASYVSPNKIDC